MKTHKTAARLMTKSPVQVAKIALVHARMALAPYSAAKSRHDFTQPQLFAILVLKAFFQTDYRGVIALLRDLSDLREVLGLKKVPHYSTLCHAEARLLKRGFLSYPSEPSFPELGSAG
jgi:hypothetical protein